MSFFEEILPSERLRFERWVEFMICCDSSRSLSHIFQLWTIALMIAGWKATWWLPAVPAGFYSDRKAEPDDFTDSSAVRSCADGRNCRFTLSLSLCPTIIKIRVERGKLQCVIADTTLKERFLTTFAHKLWRQFGCGKNLPTSSNFSKTFKFATDCLLVALGQRQTCLSGTCHSRKRYDTIGATAHSGKINCFYWK